MFTYVDRRTLVHSFFSYHEKCFSALTKVGSRYYINGDDGIIVPTLPTLSLFHVEED
jgi:hypothetical protein